MKIDADSSVYCFPLFTRLGLGFLLLGTAIPLYGFLANSAKEDVIVVLVLYVMALIARLVWECFKTARFVRSLELRVQVPNTLFSGAEAEISFQLMTEQATSARLQCRPVFPDSVALRQEEFSCQFDTSQSSCQKTVRLRPLSRGTLEVSEVTLRVYLRKALSGWQFTKNCCGETKSLVYPNALGTKEGNLKGFLKMAQGETLTHHRRGEGREFDSMRRYNQGDDIRRVDWKRSARGKGLLVKVYRPETHQRINIALDCGRRMGNLVGQRLQIEHAADAASHLIRAAKSGDDEIGLFAFNHLIQAQIPTARGSRQEKVIADSLLSVEVGSLDSDYQLLGTWAASNRKRSLLVLITSISNPAGLEVIKNALWPVRRKHLPLVCAISDRDLNELVESPASSLDDAYIISAGMQQIAQVKMRLQQLKRMGIESIYCDAKELPGQLCNKYLELKSGGRL